MSKVGSQKSSKRYLVITESRPDGLLGNSAALSTVLFLDSPAFVQFDSKAPSPLSPWCHPPERPRKTPRVCRRRKPKPFCLFVCETPDCDLELLQFVYCNMIPKELELDTGEFGVILIFSSSSCSTPSATKHKKIWDRPRRLTLLLLLFTSRRTLRNHGEAPPRSRHVPQAARRRRWAPLREV